MLDATETGACFNVRHAEASTLFISSSAGSGVMTAWYAIVGVLWVFTVSAHDVAGFMGALASQFWFLAFAVESAARIRTLALVEIFFAQLLSRTLFKQGVTLREGLGIALIVAGVIWLLRGT